jgi:hypothetical protein
MPIKNKPNQSQFRASSFYVHYSEIFLAQFLAKTFFVGPKIHGFFVFVPCVCRKYAFYGPSRLTSFPQSGILYPKGVGWLEALFFAFYWAFPHSKAAFSVL